MMAEDSGTAAPDPRINGAVAALAGVLHIHKDELRDVRDAFDAADRAAGVIRVDTTDPAVTDDLVAAMNLAIRDLHRQDNTIGTRTLARLMTAAALRTLAQR